ncbi:alpha/beta hydrolase [Embleya sp. NBC_00896]|uniref:alpha/beta fold hydrolase n=1 Tax=Embleya sp. NBC_00896 TaxID=2975961 RepID=UPI002F90833E|nr:alpha/beta hydrolase [Embleya sp. NBC_00896]
MKPRDPGLPIVFVHGIRVSGTMWRPVMEVVGDRHRVVAPDLPGHGRRRGEPFTMPAAVDTVAEAIDGLGGRALVVGLSLGGYVGIATAGRHPDRVAGLVAIGCTALPRGVLAGAARGPAGLAARYPEAGNRLSAWAFRRALPEPVAEAVLSGGLACEVVPSAMEAVVGMDPPASLAAYPGPVWLVNGARDPFRSNERAFLRACRDGRLSLWPGRGHITGLADTGALARTVLDAATVAGAAGVAPAAPAAPIAPAAPVAGVAGASEPHALPIPVPVGR